MCSKKIENGKNRSLYKTFFNDKFWLSNNPEAYVDKCIRETSVFEGYSTKAVKKLIKNGDIILDVGANIGYYSVIMSKLIGNDGKIYSFEPTKYFRDVLEVNLKINSITNVTVLSYGLSDFKKSLEIQIGSSSASLHNTSEKEDLLRETIELNVLDEVINELDINRIDFIKIDVDGHEPAFLKGALKTIEKYKPIVLLEVMHLNYLNYGISAWDFYDYLKQLGFHIFSEIDLREYKDRTEFLIECGNFAYSANILISYESKL